MKRLHCYQCEHTWLPRTSKKPMSCPHCHCRTWHIKRNQKCRICNRLLFTLHEHHINGNHKDNRKKNRISICLDCHSAVHTGISGKKRRTRQHYDFEAVNKIQQLRKKIILLK